MSKAARLFMTLAWGGFAGIVGVLIIALSIIAAMGFHLVPVGGPPGWLVGIEASSAAIMVLGMVGWIVLDQRKHR